MAKRDKDKEKGDKSLVDNIDNYEGALIDASFILEEDRKLIPVSPAIDIFLRGGIPEGSLCIFSGKSGSGKSTTALQIAANAQKEENGNRTIFYDDVEHRLSKSTLEGIRGLDSKSKFHVIRSTKEKVLSAEDHLNIVLGLIKSKPQSIFIIDSISALCGLNEMVEDVKSDFRNNGPKLLANFCRHIAPLIRLNNQVVILCSHMIADTSGRGMGGFHEDGGEKVKFASNIRMRIKYTDRWEAGSGENAKQIGQILHWGVLKSPYGVIDKLDSYLRFGIGLDSLTEAISLACDIGLIEKGGSWFTCTYLEDTPKFQGQEKLYQFLSENEEASNKLITMVKESL